MATVLDTHRVVKRLQDAGASEQLAETWTDILRESRELDLSQLATKADIAEVRRELVELKAELLKWMVGLLLGQAALVATLVKLL